MDALQNNDGKTHLIKRTSTEAKLMGFASVFMCARQEQQLSGERPQRARQQEALAEGKGVHREVESEGSRMSAGKKCWRANSRTDEQKSHSRPYRDGRVC